MKNDKKERINRSRKQRRGVTLLTLLRGSRRFFVLCILSSVLVTALEMLIPRIVSVTVDSIIGKEELHLPVFVRTWIEQIGGVERLRENLWIIALLVAVVGIVTALLKYINTYTNIRGAEAFVKTMRDRLFVSIEHLPASWHAQNKTGDIIQRCTSDVETVKQFVSNQLISIFRIVILMALSLTMMFLMHAKLALIAACSVPIVLTYSLLFRARIAKLFTACDESEGVLSAVAQENLTGVRVVRAFGREAYERDKFEEKNNIYTRLWMRLNWLFTWFWSVGDLLSGIQNLLVLVFGTVLCVRGQLTVGNLIAFISYNAMLIWPVRSLGRVISDMSKAGVSIDRIRYILNAEPEDAGGAEKTDWHGDIVFDHVSFSYDEKKKVVDDVSFTVPGGTVLGIMGGTGSGKSTLIALLDRLYDPQEGTISIGGVPVTELNREELHRAVGYVLQEPYLFSKTIAENIAITQESVDMQAVRDAATSACLDRAIEECKDGYDTVVGERGVTLSGGQKQRCAIARMLLCGCPIMVLDDSLSAVDTETDIRIREALRQRFTGSTVILISHRITSLMYADNILVMEDGKIVQSGTHEQLIAQGGIYARIAAMQKGGEVSGQ